MVGLNVDDQSISGDESDAKAGVHGEVDAVALGAEECPGL